MKSRSCVILAAGDGKRMVSEKPKVLMEVLFVPMLGWVIDAARAAGIADENIAVIIGNNAEAVSSYLASRGKFASFVQKDRLGTGHAVMQAEDFIRQKGGDVLVLCGDAPFMDKDTIDNAYQFHTENALGVTDITAEISNPANYGRIKRGEGGKLKAIVERKDCTAEELLINEVNSGAYWFEADALLSALPQIGNKNASGEYYLTDAVELIGERAGAFKSSDAKIVLGANNRKELRVLNRAMCETVNDRHYEAGVDIIGENVLIGKDVVIGQDTTIMPNTIIRGETVIGKGCVIGPCSQIDDCRIGCGAVLNNVYAANAVIMDGESFGPFVKVERSTLPVPGRQ
ncbi:MAG: NTP transferase domain-containing protein [Oscillospiraceae bacterium]|jgi:bifunctional UDP-N-acetylglucosamine pyrophosphorylase/glucosamine-1-phosphate N-acetyltransferase|nr:NTP transferase domain-containing protein [Oscillospiraceae bacterium]